MDVIRLLGNCLTIEDCIGNCMKDLMWRNFDAFYSINNVFIELFSA